MQSCLPRAQQRHCFLGQMQASFQHSGSQTLRAQFAQPHSAVQGSTLFYFTAFDSPQPRGVIPLENAQIHAGERGQKGADRRAKYLIRVEVDPHADVRKHTYLLSARSTSGQKEWLAVRSAVIGWS